MIASLPEITLSTLPGQRTGLLLRADQALVRAVAGLGLVRAEYDTLADPAQGLVMLATRAEEHEALARASADAAWLCATRAGIDTYLSGGLVQGAPTQEEGLLCADWALHPCAPGQGADMTDLAPPAVLGLLATGQPEADAGRVLAWRLAGGREAWLVYPGPPCVCRVFELESMRELLASEVVPGLTGADFGNALTALEQAPPDQRHRALAEAL